MKYLQGNPQDAFFLFLTHHSEIGIMAGVLELISSVILGIAFYAFTRARYKKIAQLSEQIDLVLHNSEHLYISEAEEGELSILQSEIMKMTLRIRAQNDELRKEKKHLADSLADMKDRPRSFPAASLYKRLMYYYLQIPPRHPIIRLTVCPS